MILALVFVFYAHQGSLLAAGIDDQCAVDRGFVYRGALYSDGRLGDTELDMVLGLYDGPETEAAEEVASITYLSVPVINGEFLLEVSFGDRVPESDDLWLGLEIRSHEAGDLVPLRPLQAIPGRLVELLARGRERDGDALGEAGCEELEGIPLELDAGLNPSIRAGGDDLVAPWEWTDSGDDLLNPRGRETPRAVVSPRLLRNEVTSVSNAKLSVSGGNINTGGAYEIGGAIVLRIDPTGTFVGAGAGSQSMGDSNTFVGWGAGGESGVAGAHSNTFVGAGTGIASSADSNTLIGKEAGTALTTGRRNTFVGRQSGQFRTIGSDNVLIGADAGEEGTLGEGNVMIGVFAGENTLGNANVFIGNRAGRFETGSDTLYIANSDTTQPLLLGNFAVPTLTIHGDLVVTGSCSGCSSDLQLKEEISPIAGALDKIERLRGVSFEWKPGTPESTIWPGRQYGVVAQEVELVFPELVGVDSEGTRFVRYHRLVAPLIEAVKELKAENDELRQRLEILEASIKSHR